MNQKIRDFFEHHEGRRNDVYKDSTGFRIVGIGHLLDATQTPDELEVLGCRQDEVHLILSITDEQIDKLFDIDYTEAFEDAQDFFGDIWHEISEVRQCVIVSQIFQLGYGGFRKFRNMIFAMRALDWERAAKESLDSVAAKQTPERWQMQANMLVNNTWDGKRTQSPLQRDTEVVSEHEVPVEERLSILEAAVKELQEWRVRNT